VFFKGIFYEHRILFSLSNNNHSLQKKPVLSTPHQAHANTGFLGFQNWQGPYRLDTKKQLTHSFVNTQQTTTYNAAGFSQSYHHFREFIAPEIAKYSLPYYVKNLINYLNIGEC